MADKPLKGFRQSMSWVHTWSGLVLGWVLYFVFVTGTAGYLDTEIDRWMQPELPVSHTQIRSYEGFDSGLKWLKDEAPDAKRWFIALPHDRNNPYLRTFWQDDDGNSGSDILDHETGQPLASRDSAGGQLLYKMHWRFHYLPRAVTDWFISVATMFMFIALITGIIIHKNIFKDFFTFRPKKGQRSWLDAHNLLSVLSLPFQLMITYSGLVFMMFLCMPLIINAFYGAENGREQLIEELFPTTVETTAAGKPANLADLQTIVSEAEKHLADHKIAFMNIEHPGDANARITFNGVNNQRLLRNSPTLIFDGVSGKLLDEIPAQGSAAKATRTVFLGLHEGLFAGPYLRILYLISGLMGTFMIATGLILWTTKRRQRLAKNRSVSVRGLALVERLNIGTIIGLPVAIAAYFWANRLLPLDLEARAEWEVHIMFISWLIMLLHAALRLVDRVWLEQLSVAAAVFLLLPVLNTLTTDRHLGQSLPAGDWVFAGFDLSMLAIGLTMLSILRKLQKNQTSTSHLNVKTSR